MIGRRNFLSLASLAVLRAAPAKPQRIFFGTYTTGSSKGIYTALFNPLTGHLEPPYLATTTPSPSFLAQGSGPSKNVLLAVGEMGDGSRKGIVSSFAVDAAGQLRPINVVDAAGANPCHIAVHPGGGMVIVANYSSGSMNSFRLDAQGKLSDVVSVMQKKGSGPNEARQKGPHAHSANFTPDGKFALCCDLGADRVFVYAVNPTTAELKAHAEIRVPGGWGPRHLALHPNGRLLYVLNELASNVCVFARKSAASWEFEHISESNTLPDEFQGQNTTAEILLDAKAQFLYASNRGHDSIAVFGVGVDGMLKRLGHVPSGGKTPRSFALDASGEYLLIANQNTGDVIAAKRDKSGLAKQTGPAINIDRAVCVHVWR